MLLSCGLMGWWRWHLHAYHEQQTAVVEVSRKAVYLRFLPGQPPWLQRFADPEVFRDVVHLSFHGRRDVTDDDLKQLAHFRRLKRLSLDRTSVTDQGLVHLAGLTELETLSLKNTKVTSAGLAHLRELRNMKKLQLGRTQIDGRGLAHLTLMTKLEVLELDNLPIADEHLASLEDMRELQTLWLWFSKVRGEGLQSLRPLPELAELRLHSDILEHAEFRDWPALQTLLVAGPPQSAPRFVVRDCPRLASVGIEGSSSLIELQNLPRLSTFTVGRYNHPRAQESELRLRHLPAVKSLELRLPGHLSLELADLTALQSLSLFTHHLRAANFLNVPSLTTLSLASAELSEDSAQGFSELPPLIELSLNGVRSPRPFLEQLGSLAVLEKLNLISTDLGKSGLVPLRDAKRLKTFVYGYASAREGLFEPLSHCDELESLKLQHVEIQSLGLRGLGELTHLKTIEFVECKIAPGNLAQLLDAASLHTVHFDSMRLATEDLVTISSWSNLEQLRLNGVLGLSQADFSPLARLRKLRQITLWDIGAPPEGLQALSAALPGECLLIYNPKLRKTSGRPFASQVLLQRGVPVDEAESYYSE